MVFDTFYCTGCRSCEIACSFHHQKRFISSKSSIEIVDKRKEMGFGILIYRKAEKDRPMCDRCEGMEEKMCVKHCPVIAREELRGIINKED